MNYSKIVEALQAEVADKDHLIKQQTNEIQRLMADIKRQQEKMFELAKKLPKRGEWVRKESENTYWFECSECGGYPMRDTWDGEGKLTDFCPRCGADMRKMWEVQNG